MADVAVVQEKAQPETVVVPKDKLDMLIEMVTDMRQEMALIRLRLDELEDSDELPNPKESLRRSLLEAKLGLTFPIETLWDGIDAE
ncbi:MAG: hypothetical protein KDE46_26215 [Caldilineaceae bacterium]|nr:hypothetical protein [Caldilineaceae bacterium]